MKEHEFKVNNVFSGYDKTTIVKGIDLVIPSHKISVIIGANACGKSTLLKTMSRLLKPTQGSITLDGKNIYEYPPKQLACMLGLLPQSPIAPEGIAVSDLVGRGRFPHQSFLKGWSQQDYDAVSDALHALNIESLANKSVDELSGGQRQRVWIAMALAQQTDILLLDEPTTYLDITYQIEILDVLTKLNEKKKITIVMILHDMNLSARYADYIFALKKGQLITQGTPKEVITQETIKTVFDLDCTIVEDPLSGSPMMVPKGKYHMENSK